MDIEKLDSWLSLLRAIPVTLLVVLVAHFLGSQCITWSRQSSSSNLPDWASVHFASLLGMNLLGLMALAVAMVPISLRFILIALLSMAACYSTARQIRSARTIFEGAGWLNVGRALGQLVTPNGRGLPFYSRVGVGLLIAFTLGPALAYPSGWDELTYHIELPRRWYNTAILDVQPDLPYSALPSLLEAIFTLTYPVESLITPRLLVWVVWLQGIFVFRDVCCQLGSRGNANCLTFALAASPTALLISANCYVESLIWANVACAMRTLVVRNLANIFPLRAAVLLGVFIGGAIAIKMTSVGLLCLPILFVVWNHRNAKRDWQGALVAILTAICFAGPFYLRTWILTGNPVAPFFAQWFTTDASVIECSRYHHDLAVGNFGMHGWPGFIVGPGALAFANELYDGSLGWQWLALLLLFAIAAARAFKPDHLHRPLLLLCLTAAVLFYSLWFITSQQARFAIPLVMVVAAAACRGIGTYHAPVQRWWRLAIIALSMFSLPWNNVGYYLDSWLCVLKIRTPVDYIRDGVTDSYAELALHLQEHIPADARIVSLFEHRLAYLPPNVEIATPYFQVKHFRTPQSQTPESLMAELREKQIRYVVLTTSPLGPDVSPARIDAQQSWFRNVDQCIDSGQLKIIWKSEFHGIAEVTGP